MLPSKNNFFDHMKWLREAATGCGADLLIAGDTMQALLRRGERHWLLHPMFFAVVDGVGQYVPTLVEQATHFCGWLPYQGRRWPLASDKLLFKRIVQELGLPTPHHSIVSGEELKDVVVKRSMSSFGDHVLGPFRSSKERPLNAMDGEYYESFVEGETLKVWYWNGQPVVMELDSMPTVVGDGLSTLRQHIERRANIFKRQGREDFERIAERCAVTLRYSGIALDDVLPSGKRQLIEFRYGSDLMHPRARTVVDLRANTDSQWELLRRAGGELQSAIPPDVRRDSLFTLDLVRDRKKNLWLLEMNSNPAVHPLVYPAMIGAMLDQGQAAKRVPGIPVSAAVA